MIKKITLTLIFVLFFFGFANADQRILDPNKYDCFDAGISQAMQLEIKQCREKEKLISALEEKLALQEQIIEKQKELLSIKDEIIAAQKHQINVLKATDMTKEFADIINIQGNVLKNLKKSPTQQILEKLPFFIAIIFLCL